MKIGLISFFILLPILGFSQEPIFRQFNSVPISFNPSFAGIDSTLRIGGTFQHYNYTSDAAFSKIWYNNYLNIDGFSQKLRGSLALIVSHSRAQNNSASYSNLDFAYSPHLMFKEVTIKPSVQLGANNIFFNYNKIPKTAPVVDSAVLNYGSIGDWTFNINTGILFSYKSNTIGLSFFHLNRPVFASIAPVPNFGYPIRWVFHFHKKLIWQTKFSENIYITPLLVIKKGNPVAISAYDDFTFIGIDIKKRETTLGCLFGMETRDGFISRFQRKEITLMAGYDFERVKLMYSITQLGGHLNVRNIINQFSVILYPPNLKNNKFSKVN